MPRKEYFNDLEALALLEELPSDYDSDTDVDEKFDKNFDVALTADPLAYPQIELGNEIHSITNIPTVGNLLSDGDDDGQADLGTAIDGHTSSVDSPTTPFRLWKKRL